MHSGKIEIFERNNERAFPRFRSLSRLEAKSLKDRLIQRSGLSPRIDSLELLHKILESSREICEVLEDDSLDVRLALERNGQTCSDLVYLDWHRFDEVDEMAEEVLSKNFDDIWYPSADDLGIFDETLDWILLVQHWGSVFLYQPPPV